MRTTGHAHAPTSVVVLGLIGLAAIAQRALVMPNADVAWLLTVAERMLDGQRLYIDIIETNPPFSVYLYLPAAALGRWLDLRAEWVSDALVFAGAWTSLFYCVRLLRRSGLMEEREPLPLSAAGALVLLVLPAACFGEREHVALIAVLPYLCLTAARATGEHMRPIDVAIGAICVGLVLVIKPHFAAAIAPVGLLLAIRLRNWRALFMPEAIIGAAIAAIYLVATLVLHPAFWSQMMPMVRATYLPVRYTPLAFIWQFKDLTLALIALLTVAMARGWRHLAHPITLAAAAALGFFVAVVVQGKGMPYHFYPPLGLALLAAVATGNGGARLTPPRLLAFGLAFVFWTWFNAGFDMRDLVQPVRQAAAHPRVLALGYDFSAGPPVARAAGGTYVGRTASQWTADNVHWLQQNDALTREVRSTLAAFEERDRTLFIEDLLTQRPDVLLVQRQPEDWMGWAEKDKRFETALRAFDVQGRYRSQGMRNGTTLVYEVWVRRNSAP